MRYSITIGVHVVIEFRDVHDARIWADAQRAAIEEAAGKIDGELIDSDVEVEEG